MNLDICISTSVRTSTSIVGISTSAPRYRSSTSTSVSQHHFGIRHGYLDISIPTSRPRYRYLDIEILTCVSRHRYFDIAPAHRHRYLDIGISTSAPRHRYLDFDPAHRHRYLDIGISTFVSRLDIGISTSIRTSTSKPRYRNLVICTLTLVSQHRSGPRHHCKESVCPQIAVS